MGSDWKLLAVVPLTFGVVAVVALAFSADANASAAFFGSFAAAGATVIAVLLGAEMQRRNDREREKRARDVELAAVATEIAILMRAKLVALKSIHDPIDEVARWDARYSIISPAKPMPQLLLESSAGPLQEEAVPLEERLRRELGRFPRGVAEPVFFYMAIAEDSRTFASTMLEGHSKHLRFSAFISQEEAKMLRSYTSNMQTAARRVEKEMTEFLSGLNI